MEFARSEADTLDCTTSSLSNCFRVSMETLLPMPMACRTTLLAARSGKTARAFCSAQ
ncbi:hypothetical protein D3C75_654400 [compost metagenome]